MSLWISGGEPNRRRLSVYSKEIFTTRRPSDFTARGCFLSVLFIRDTGKGLLGMQEIEEVGEEDEEDKEGEGREDETRRKQVSQDRPSGSPGIQEEGLFFTGVFIDDS